MMNDRKRYNMMLDETTDYKKGLTLILRHIKPYLPKILLILLFTLFTTILGHSILQLLIKRAIDVDIVNRDKFGLLATTVIYIFLAILNMIFNYTRLLFAGRISQNILFNIRNEVFKKIQDLPSKFFSQNQSGDIIQRLTGNVDGINNFFSEGLVRFFTTVFTLIVIFVSMWLQNWVLALVAMGCGILMIVVILIQGKILEKPISKSLKREGLMSSSVQESLDGFIAIQSGNQQNSWIRKCDLKARRYYKTSKKITLIYSLFNSLLAFLTVLIIALILIVALTLFKANIITLGTVILFLAYTQDFFRNVVTISDIWRNVKIGIASSERLADILELESDIKNFSNPYTPKELQGDIEFIDVDFGYEKNQKVLSDINFKIRRGQTIAIVGPTGAGKTTFVNLIARLYDVDNGEILVDGIPIKEWDLHRLRKNIGYLIQDPFLFEDTIINNLRYNNPSVTEKDALDMFDFLGVSSFLKSFPDGLETKITPHGNGMSAGQRQIIALARILLRKPKVLILDEATARIDTKSEKMLQSAIEKATGGKTTFIIAHRLSTIFNADNIVLIKDHTILEIGTHKELLEKKGLYWEMYSRFIGK